jgi:predicted transcriptional regulator
VVDHEIDRHERIDRARIATELGVSASTITKYLSGSVPPVSKSTGNRIEAEILKALEGRESSHDAQIAYANLQDRFRDLAQENRLLHAEVRKLRRFVDRVVHG